MKQSELHILYFKCETNLEIQMDNKYPQEKAHHKLVPANTLFEHKLLQKCHCTNLSFHLVASAVMHSY